ncbi:MAG TPA: hypothetical protein VF549_18570 [Solirubrobacteraceae bacterium]|jgi:hypothetical protein
MKRITLSLAAIAAVAATAVPMAAQAQEQTDPNAKATFLGSIKPKGEKATLRVRYNCAEGETLWISAKQMKNGKKSAKLKAEGSSKVAAAWWQSHRNPVTCDGAKHTATFTIDKVEDGSKGTLRKGQAWVQFCVTKGDALVLSASKFVRVK